MESPNNIGFVCAEHASKPITLTDEQISKLVGTYVKVGFPEKAPSNHVEHMWIFVEALLEGDTKFTGKLDNDPVLDVGVAYGDVITRPISDIEDMVG